MRLIDLDNINSIELEDSVCHLKHSKGDEVDWSIDAPIVNAVVIKECMTNGDVITAMFPNSKIFIDKRGDYHYVYVNNPIMGACWKIREEWWDSPYKECEEE